MVHVEEYSRRSRIRSTTVSDEEVVEVEEQVSDLLWAGTGSLLLLSKGQQHVDLGGGIRRLHW